MNQIKRYSKEFPDRVALSDGISTLTYRELRRDIEEKAKFVLGSKHERFFLYGGNDIETISYIYATAMAGKLLLCIPDFVPRKLKLMIARSAGINRDIRKARGYICFDYPGDGRVAVFTSGTTGRPVAVAQNEFVLSRDWSDIISQTGVESGDVIYTTAPVTAAPMTYLMLLGSGCSVHFSNETRLTSRGILDGYLRSGADTLFVSPSVLDKIVTEIGLEPFLSLKRVVTASMPFTEELAAKIGQVGIDIVDVYASSEAGAIGYRRPLHESEFSLFDHVKVESVGDDLVIPEASIYTASAQVVNGGLVPIEFPLHVGDSGTLAGHRLSLTGRSSSRVKVSGFSVSFDVIKEFARRSGAEPVDVYATKVWGKNRITLVVKHGISEARLRSRLSKALPWYYVPQEIRYV